MAFLKDDFNFTHVIAIDFGTGASGYTNISLKLICYIDMVLPLKLLSLDHHQE